MARVTASNRGSGRSGSNQGPRRRIKLASRAWKEDSSQSSARSVFPAPLQAPTRAAPAIHPPCRFFSSSRAMECASSGPPNCPTSEACIDSTSGSSPTSAGAESLDSFLTLSQFPLGHRNPPVRGQIRLVERDCCPPLRNSPFQVSGETQGLRQEPTEHRVERLERDGLLAKPDSEVALPPQTLPECEVAVPLSCTQVAGLSHDVVRPRRPTSPTGTAAPGQKAR